MRPKKIKTLQGRARNLQTQFINSHTIVVESITNSLANHVVTVSYKPDGTIHARCTCPWAINGGVGCSHVLAALEAVAGKRGRALSFWDNYDAAKKQKRRIFYLAGERANRESGLWITSRAA